MNRKTRNAAKLKWRKSLLHQNGDVWVAKHCCPWLFPGRYSPVNARRKDAKMRGYYDRIKAAAKVHAKRAKAFGTVVMFARQSGKTELTNRWRSEPGLNIMRATREMIPQFVGGNVRHLIMGESSL